MIYTLRAGDEYPYPRQEVDGDEMNEERVTLPLLAAASLP
jgi:hypothetical protein